MILKHFALIIDHPVCDMPSVPYRVKEKLYFTGVMVGATADMVLQPYGAVTAGL